MIEVFKTNVSCYEQAAKLVEDIHKSFEGYIANFDLDDCDRILRIVSAKGKVQSMRLIDFLKAHGYHAEVLPG